MDPALDQAIAFLTTPSAKLPAPEAVVEALIQAEKTAKQSRVRHTYPQLLGTWRLGFITGTKRSRKRAGVILGAGRFLPSWVKIHLSYLQTESNQEQGTVQNSVAFGLLQLVLTGPTQFWSKTNMLAFDFTRMRVSLSGLKLYDGYIRKGQDREARFYEQGVKEQAFFTYFLVENQSIAARGRGGGLALWTRVSDS
ncbi:MAG: hypothetical protein KME25_08235 [Symplocastrum torsivum CPER-KK1]|uniref:Plastid lipid-associated protein/fibrillin conserved domain-containing protein n=1 Tax=Symplocastrum torsivum CPER-KK1 TaxID=450513 RepID=A0A951PIC3_9CYAN|nr:hypothetical protein [Symplocastrum torsivum CPER-KK1]